MSYVATSPSLPLGAMLEAERIEGEAWTDIVRAVPRARAAELGLSATHEGGAVALRSTAIDHLLVNRVLGLGHTAALSQRGLGRLVESYRALGISRFFLQVSGQALDAEAERWLGAAGLVRYPRSWVKLGTRLGSVMPAKSGFDIARVTHLHADACAEIVSHGFALPESARILFRALSERPRWHLYAALESGRPIATAGLFVDGATAYLAFASTLPAYQRHGAQSALLERRLRVALALGATFVVSETGEAVAGDPQHSYGNLTRAGLRPLGTRANWAPPGTCW